MSQRLNYVAVSPAGMKALAGVHAYINQPSVPKPLIDLTIATGLMNTYNRMAITFRTTSAAVK